MNIKELEQLVIKFRDDRNWKQYHTPKNLTQALASEVGELNDLYLWNREPEKSSVGQEMADILIYLLSLADIAEIDLTQEIIFKLQINEVKYPIKKARGNDKKYSEL